MKKENKKREWLKFVLITGASIIVIVASVLPAFAMTNVTRTNDLIKVQGSQTLSQLYYDKEGNLQKQFVIPLSPTYLTYDTESSVTWQSNFYYADFEIQLTGNNSSEIMPIGNESITYTEFYPRVEVKQENVPTQTIEKIIVEQAKWGESQRYTQLDTTFYTKMNDYVIWTNGTQWVNENNIPYDELELRDIDEVWTTYRFEMNNILNWNKKQFRQYLDGDNYHSMLTLFKVGAYYLGEYDQEKGFPIKLSNVYAKVYNLANPSETRELTTELFRLAWQPEEGYYYIGTEEKEYAKEEGEIWVIETLKADISMRISNHIEPPKIYMETKYNVIEPIDKIQYAVQHYEKIELPNTVDLGSWLAKGVGSFMGMEIAEGISIGGILGVFIAFGTTMWLMKVFLGG